MIYGGDPVLVEKRELTGTEQSAKPLNPIKTIQKYSWLDEEKKVKIYIDLE